MVEATPKFDGGDSVAMDVDAERQLFASKRTRRLSHCCRRRRPTAASAPLQLAYWNDLLVECTLAAEPGCEGRGTRSRCRGGGGEAADSKREARVGGAPRVRGAGCRFARRGIRSEAAQLGRFQLDPGDVYITHPGPGRNKVAVTDSVGCWGRDSSLWADATAAVMVLPLSSMSISVPGAVASNRTPVWNTTPQVRRVITIDRAGMAALRLRCIANSALNKKSNLQDAGTLLSHTP
jgi:hypothetical protein